jgi:hypothetical protein
LRSVETWNKLGRFVNKGTKGIALLVERMYPTSCAMSLTSRIQQLLWHTISLWQMRALRRSSNGGAGKPFGELLRKTALAENLTSFAGLVVDDNFSDYLRSCSPQKKEVFLKIGRT